MNNYNRLNDTVAINAGAFPQSMVKEDGTLENQWGGYVLVSHAQDDGQLTEGTQVRRYFRIIYTQVPSDVCIRLVGAAAKNFGLIRVSKTGVAYSQWDIAQNHFAAERVEFDEDLTAKNCKGTGGKAAITFVSN